MEKEIKMMKMLLMIEIMEMKMIMRKVMMMMMIVLMMRTMIALMIMMMVLMKVPSEPSLDNRDRISSSSFDILFLEFTVLDLNNTEVPLLEGK